jgi:hypothetical protein
MPRQWWCPKGAWVQAPPGSVWLVEGALSQRSVRLRRFRCRLAPKAACKGALQRTLACWAVCQWSWVMCWMRRGRNSSGMAHRGRRLSPSLDSLLDPGIPSLPPPTVRPVEPSPLAGVGCVAGRSVLQGCRAVAPRGWLRGGQPSTGLTCDE